MFDLRSLFGSIGTGEVPRESVTVTVRSMKESAQRTIKALELLEALRTSWNQRDPGKGMPYVFFVRDFSLQWGGGTPSIAWCDAFFARGFVTDIARAAEGVPHYDDHRPARDKRTSVPLGEFREAKLERCNVCAHASYVVGRHWQSCDSPDGDTWELELLSLCPDCLHVDRIGHRVDGYRMGHLLKRPEGR